MWWNKSIRSVTSKIILFMLWFVLWIPDNNMFKDIGICEEHSMQTIHCIVMVLDVLIRM